MRYLAEYDWLVVAFVHEITDSLDQTKDFVRQIEQAPHQPGSPVFLIKDELVKSMHRPGGVVHEFVLHVEKLEWTPDGRQEFRPVPDLPIYNPDKHCWRKAFEYIYTRYRGKRNMLITLSHGAGLAINSDQDRVARPNTTRMVSNPYYFLDRQDVDRLDLMSVEGMVIAPELRDHIRRGELPKTDGDKQCRSLNVLWIYELVDALELYLPDDTIDLLLMVNCNMQLFDASYMLSRKVDYLVAPEGSISAPGYDYQRLFTRLSQRPDIPCTELVRAIVEDYRLLTAEDGFTSLFGNYLKPFPALVEVFRSFVALVVSRMEEMIGGLEDIRNNQMEIVSRSGAFTVDFQDQVDLSLWVKLVAKAYTSMPQLTDLQQAIERLRNTIVHDNVVGQSFLDHDAMTNKKLGYSGVSIFYPETTESWPVPATGWCVYFNGKIPDTFKTRSGWGLFLTKYFDLVGRTGLNRGL